MKKGPTSDVSADRDTMRPEYDFSGGGGEARRDGSAVCAGRERGCGLS